MRFKRMGILAIFLSLQLLFLPVSSLPRFKRQSLVEVACKRQPSLPYCPKPKTTTTTSTTTTATTTESRTTESTTEETTTVPTTTTTTSTTTTPTTTSTSTTTSTQPTTKSTPSSIDIEAYCKKYSSGYTYYCADLDPYDEDLQGTLMRYCSNYIKYCNPTPFPTTPRTTKKAQTTAAALFGQLPFLQGLGFATAPTTTAAPATTPLTFFPPVPPPGNSVAPVLSGNRNPDQVFKQCCDNNKKLVDSCKYLCSFSNLNKQKMIDAFIKGTCPGYAPRHVVNCASFGGDHLDCCRRNGVDKINNGQCMPFCNPTMRGHIGMGIEAFPCLDAFPKITKCFIEGMP